MVFVYFMSDNSHNYQGFEILYSVVEGKQIAAVNISHIYNDMVV